VRSCRMPLRYSMHAWLRKAGASGYFEHCTDGGALGMLVIVDAALIQPRTIRLTLFFLMIGFRFFALFAATVRPVLDVSPAFAVVLR
jgi:hypothetical protein